MTAVAALAAAFAPATAHAGSEPVVDDCTTYPAQSVVRPANLMLACGDGGLWVKDIAWTSWGPETAEGEGTQYRRICVPNCASGGVSTAPTHITLRNPVADKFTQAEISDLNGKPKTWPM
ncbi:hypothetical protein [Nocardia crassostreae]|uniref:hypothetical protein n=1 Tax=Nocardia crassostreae TaxID=53428 RepID=UPI0012FC1294|nr:hypothetical protein [Nocardia crassostreae]